MSKNSLDNYMQAYEEITQQTATKHAPWHVVPANNKWFTRVVVAAAVIEALAVLDLTYPKVGEDKLKKLARRRRQTVEKVAGRIKRCAQSRFPRR